MKKKLLAGLAALIALGAGSVAFASVRGGPERGHERARKFMLWRLDDALDDLDATDAQRAAAQQSASGLMDEALKLRASKDTLHAELAAQLRSEAPDANAVHAGVDRMFDDVRAFAHKGVDSFLALHHSLSPTQRGQLAERMEKHRGRFSH